MIETPCEQYRYILLPNIRKELANCLIEIFKLSQRQAAIKLGITPAAVCQYRKKKRGGDVIFSQKLMMEFVSSANRINTHGETVVQKELCRLCNKVKREKAIDKIQYKKKILKATE